MYTEWRLAIEKQSPIGCHLPDEWYKDVCVATLNLTERELGVFGPYIQRLVQDPAHSSRAVVHIDGTL